MPFSREVLGTFPATTWYLRISPSFSLFSGRSRSSSVPSGRAAKASLVGATTMIKDQEGGQVSEYYKQLNDH